MLVASPCRPVRGTHPRTHSRRKRRGSSRLTLPSRYLLEIPVELTEKGSAEPDRSAEEKQEMASNFFRNIKDIIGDKAASAPDRTYEA